MNTLNDKKIKFYVDGGKEYFWPEISDWDVIFIDKCDRLYSCTVIFLQDCDSGMIVKFDGDNIALGKGDGSYDFYDYGKTYTGNFKNIKEIEKILMQIKNSRDKRQKQFIDYLRKNLKNYIVSDDGEDISKKINNDYSIGISIFSDGGDKFTLILSLMDYGEYRGRIINRKEIAVSLKNIPNTIFEYEKGISKYI